MGKALRSVHGALQAPDGALRDDVLATVWILANYEVLYIALPPLFPLFSFSLLGSLTVLFLNTAPCWVIEQLESFEPMAPPFPRAVQHPQDEGVENVLLRGRSCGLLVCL